MMITEMLLNYFLFFFHNFPFGLPYYLRLVMSYEICEYAPKKIGRRLTTAGKVAVRKWIYIYHMVSFRPNKFGEYWARKTVSILVSRGVRFMCVFFFSFFLPHSFVLIIILQLSTNPSSSTSMQHNFTINVHLLISTLLYNDEFSTSVPCVNAKK